MDALADRQLCGHEVWPEPDGAAGLRVGAENRPADRLVARSAQSHEANDFSLTDSEGQRPLISRKKVLDLQQRRIGADAKADW